jgi:hypothetical protein
MSLCPGTATGESVGASTISGRVSQACQWGENWAIQATVDFDRSYVCQRRKSWAFQVTIDFLNF